MTHSHEDKVTSSDDDSNSPSYNELEHAFKKIVKILWNSPWNIIIWKKKIIH